MFFEAFKTTAGAVMQIFLIGALGFALVRRGMLDDKGLNAVSRLALDVALPAMIFDQLARNFSFSLYPAWWKFPLLSFAITLAGLAVGAVLSFFIKDVSRRLQFMSLTAFQNSGYLPLALAAALLPAHTCGTMFIYIFLFLLGFNFAIFSLGVYMLAVNRSDAFDARTLISPPVAATIATLAFIAMGWQAVIPSGIMKTVKMVGDCALPLALLVVGGNLAQTRLTHVEPGPMALLILGKLLVMPAVGLFFVLKYRLPELLGLLIVIELAMPPATTLSVLIRHYRRQDVLISQGIFLGHLASLVTIPAFLSLYFVLNMVE